MKRTVLVLLAALGLVVGVILAVSFRPDTADPKARPPGGIATDTDTCTPTAARPGPVIDLGVQASTGTGTLPAEQVAALTTSAAEAGAAVISTVVRFEAAKPSAGSPMQFLSLDRTLQAARARGMKVRLTVYGMPAWAYDTPPAHLDNDADDTYAPPLSEHELGHWRALLTELLEHVGPDLAYLEIWTEPNTAHYWNTGASPASFARLLTVSDAVVKRLSPRTKVISGGISGPDTAFLDGVLSALPGGDLPFDLVGVHLFGSRSESSRGWLTSYRAIHELEVARQVTAPIYLTSFGYKVGPGLTDRDRAGFLSRALAVLTCTPYVEVASWYYLHPTPWDSPEWTLLDAAGTPNETWRALAAWSRTRKIG